MQNTNKQIVSACRYISIFIVPLMIWQFLIVIGLTKESVSWFSKIPIKETLLAIIQILGKEVALPFSVISISIYFIVFFIWPNLINKSKILLALSLLLLSSTFFW